MTTTRPGRASGAAASLRELARSWLARYPRPVAREYEPDLAAHALLDRLTSTRPADDQRRLSAR